MIKKITYLLLLLSFLVPSVTLAGTTDLTLPCIQDSDCASGLCGQSTLTGTQTKFCVCKTATDCENKYKKDPPSETWTCEAGIEKSKGLPFCNSNPNGPEIPMSAEAATPPAPESEAASTPIKLTRPSITIPIPSLPSFTEIEAKAGETINVPYLATYVIAIYKYGLTIGSILAVMVIVIGGVMYMISSADPSKIALAKQLIFGSITGITLLICSYLLLKVINPNLTNLNSLKIETIETVSDFDFLEATSKAGPDYVSPGEAFVPSGTPVTSTGQPVILDGNQTYEMAQAIAKQHMTPFCNVKEASEKSVYPGLSINYQYLGSLDCNTSSGKRAKIAKIIIHNGFGYSGNPVKKIGTCITMWRRNRLGYSVVCEKTTISTKKGPKQKWNDSGCEKAKATVGQKIFVTAPASTHYYIEHDGTIYQTVGENLISTHCAGTPGKTSCNKDSIGIDIVYKQEPDGKFSYTEKVYESLGKLLKAIAQKHNLTIKDDVVFAHSDCQANRVDPYYLNWEKVATYSGGTLTSKAHPKSQGGKSGYLCN